MKSHPGGLEESRRMIELAALPAGARVLDLGAGAGETVALLRELGYEARGVDLEPRGAWVEAGNYLACREETGSFDGIVAQCTFYVSGDPEKALREARRLLRPGGVLMLADVCPVGKSLQTMAEAAGFRVRHREDQTPAWKEYYIESIWRGTWTCEPIRGKFVYERLICEAV